MLLVGGSDSDNEQLSLQIASPEDWWFHVDGVPGSHTVLRAKDDQQPVPGQKLLASVGTHEPDPAQQPSTCGARVS